jgi:hypothetical protein
MISIPIDIQNIILEFTGYHKKRNGIFMRQIPEAQLKMLEKKMKKIPKIKNGYVELTMSKSKIKRETLILIGPSFYYDIKSTRL